MYGTERISGTNTNGGIPGTFPVSPGCPLSTQGEGDELAAAAQGWGKSGPCVCGFGQAVCSLGPSLLKWGGFAAAAC